MPRPMPHLIDKDVSVLLQQGIIPKLLQQDPGSHEHQLRVWRRHRLQTNDVADLKQTRDRINDDVMPSDGKDAQPFLSPTALQVHN